MRIKRLLFVLMFVSCALSARSQKLSVFGEIRPRAEYREGYGKPLKETEGAAVFVQQRSRFGAAFSNSLIKMQITLQDSRTWGEAAHNADIASVNIYEAWAEILVSPGLTIKAGRQPLKYDDRKLFSPANWSVTGNTHDVFTLKYNYDNDFLADASVAYGNNSGISKETLYTPGMKYRMMGILWFSKKLAKPLTLTAIGVVMSNQDTISCGGKVNYKEAKFYSNYTIGGTLNYTPESIPLRVSLEGYMQSGKYNVKGSLDKMGGTYLIADAKYSLTPFLAIKGGYEYLSGDDDGSDGKVCEFKHLFRGNHDFNGSMDYWNSTGANGLKDIYGGLVLKFNKKRTSADITYHSFTSAVDVDAMDGKSLGSEIDITLKHTVSQWLSLEGGWSYYAVNDNVRTVKGMAGKDTRGATWAYISMSVKPSVIVGLK